MRTYNRDGQENVVFSMNLLDSEGTEIQATMFNQAAKKFYPIIEEGSIYFIAKGRVTIARQKYTHIRNDYAITLNENSEVTLVPENDNFGNNNNNSDNNGNSNKNPSNGPILQQVYRFTSIENISKRNAGSFVDICAIVSEVKELGTVISKTSGKELKRRTIALCDNSGKLIEMTIWGNMAQEYDSNKLGNNAVVVIKGARVREYAGGKQLTCNNKVLVNPFNNVNEAKQLQHWWNNQGGKKQKFEPLASSAAGGASKMYVATIFFAVCLYYCCLFCFFVFCFFYLF